MTSSVQKLLSKRQLKTIVSVPSAKLDLHCGPYGSGKTYAMNIALGLACSTSPAPDSDSCIALIGKTAQAVKNNIGNGLASLYGANFRYDSGRKDGYSKDAVLFGHRLRIIGFNDSGAEDRIRGLNAYKIIGDEVSTWGQENYLKVFGRIRGECPVGWKTGFIGTTNPDSPSHWLKKIIDNNVGMNYVQWTEHDRITPDAMEYYQGLRDRFRNNPAYINRYVHGLWSAAEGLVYKDFNDKHHLLTDDELAGIEFTHYKLGIDFGTSNATAILLIGVTSDDVSVIIKEVYIKDANLTQVVKAVIGLVMEYPNRISKIIVDPAALVLIKELRSHGLLNVLGGVNSVMDGIDYVRDMFNTDRLFIHNSCTELVDELYGYALSQKDGVNVVKVNDHACDAMRYGLYTA